MIRTVEVREREREEEVKEEKEGGKMIEISGSDLVNKEEFYRSALKSHSLNAYKKQAMAKLTGSSGYQERQELASRGKNRNQLASLATEQADLFQI